MKLINLKISEITPYDKNPRINDKAVPKVAESIKAFGFKVPIIVDKDQVIIAGHTRYKAAIALKMEEVPCIIADDLSEDQVKAFRIADNRVAEEAEWDYDLLTDELRDLIEDNFNLKSLGFDNDELKELLDDNDLVEDEAPPIPDVPRAKRGEIYRLGRHRVMCGDSTEHEDVRKLMNGQQADLVMTDPPYNVNYQSKSDNINKYGYNFKDQRILNDYLPELQFLEFLNNAFECMEEAMKAGAPYYIWHAFQTQTEFEYALRNNEMRSRQQIIWVKNAIVLGRQDYQWRHEPCLYGWKPGRNHYFIDDRTQSTVIDDKINVNKLTKDEMKALLKSMLEDKKTNTIVYEDKPHSNNEHPTMKPIKLLAPLIRNSSRQEDIILDLFGGSGSTLIACEQINRSCYMMELDEKYIDVIVDRWENFTGLKAEKE